MVKNMKIKVRIFFEVMGWPEDALNEHLKKLMDKLKEKWKVFSEDYSKPDKISEKMYTSHVEFEAEIPSIQDLFAFVLNYAPSAIEILDPPEIYMTAGDLQDILADMVSKIQGMDKEIKVLSSQNTQMKRILSQIEQARQKHLKEKAEKEPESKNKPEESRNNKNLKNT